MKGAEPLSAILLTGILISVVGSVYFWGVPLIEKNQDIATLQSSENFMINLKNKIKSVANSGGREEVRITAPGLMVFQNQMINFTVETQGTQYSTGALISLGRNFCGSNDGFWGEDEPETLCVLSKGETQFTTTYSLKFIQLNLIGQNQPIQSYKINLTGNPSRGGENRIVLIENLGSEINNRSVITKVDIKIT